LQVLTVSSHLPLLREYCLLVEGYRLMSRLSAPYSYRAVDMGTTYKKALVPPSAEKKFFLYEIERDEIRSQIEALRLDRSRATRQPWGPWGERARIRKPSRVT
jgi:hypothetical protein